MENISSSETQGNDWSVWSWSARTGSRSFPGIFFGGWLLFGGFGWVGWLND